jgi:transcriptional regulator with XRE-family HTH domain
MQDMHIAEHRRLSGEELGRRIERARGLAGMSQSKLASALGCDQSTISRLEAGRGLESADLERIAEVTGLPIDFFLRLEEPVGVLLRAEDTQAPATRLAVEAFSRFVSDYEFLLDLHEA